MEYVPTLSMTSLGSRGGCAVDAEMKIPSAGTTETSTSLTF